jgi:hypothetical protein
VAVFSRLITFTKWVSVAAAAFGFIGQALAAPFGPEEATELLARTFSANQKCKVLNQAETDQLQSFVAQAEVALAEQSGVPKTKSTLDRGRAAGQKVACDATTAKAVRGVLLTARDALASSSDLRTKDVAQNESDDADAIQAEPLEKKQNPQKKTAEDTATASEGNVPPSATPVVTAANRSETAKPVEKKTVEQKPVPQKSLAKPTQTRIQVATVTAKPATNAKIAAKPATKSAKRPGAKTEADAAIETASVKKPLADKAAIAKKPTSGPALVAYAKLAEAYFVELKCRNMSKSDVQAFYGKVMQNHRKAVAAHGGASVSGTLRSAQARANGKSCG